MATDAKILVVYYSRTGTTKTVGTAIAEQLAADAEEIEDKKKRGGILGFFGGGKDSFRKHLTTIGNAVHSPSDYDVVVIGTPVWAASIAPAVRTYISQCEGRLPKVAFFLTTGGSGIDRTFRHMAALCGKEPVAVLGLRAREVKKGDPAELVRAFAEKVLAAQQG